MISRVALLVLSAAALAARPAAAQQAPAAEVYELNRVEVAPRPLNVADMAAALNASYPAALRAAGVSGTVRVSMIVGADGVPRDARVLESADSAFNAPTLAAVQTLRFSPAELNDRPVSVRVELPVAWRIEPAAAAVDVARGPDANGVYELRAVTVQPRPRNTRDLMRAMESSYPPDLKVAGDGGRVVVRFVVEPDGRPTGITVLQSSAPALNGPTIHSVSKLRFDPARVDGRPVRVWVELPIEWHVAR